MTEHSWIADEVVVVVQRLRENGFRADDGMRQVLNLAEEVGEFVGAYRRWRGLARRGGTAEEAHAELADVVITAYVTAHELGFDLDAAVAAKLGHIHSRAWKES